MAKQKIVTSYILLVSAHGFDEYEVWDLQPKEGFFTTVKEATQYLVNVVDEDPDYYAGYKFKVAAVTNQVLSVGVQVEATLNVFIPPN